MGFLFTMKNMKNTEGVFLSSLHVLHGETVFKRSVNIIILIITDLGGGYAAERQCDIAWGFNPKSVLIFFFAPQ